MLKLNNKIILNCLKFQKDKSLKSEIIEDLQKFANHYQIPLKRKKNYKKIGVKKRLIEFMEMDKGYQETILNLYNELF